MVGVIVIWPYEGIIVRYFALMGAIKLVGHPGPKTLITLCLIRLHCRIQVSQLNPTDVERKKDKFITQGPVTWVWVFEVVGKGKWVAGGCVMEGDGKEGCNCNCTELQTNRCTRQISHNVTKKMSDVTRMVKMVRCHKEVTRMVKMVRWCKEVTCMVKMAQRETNQHELCSRMHKVYRMLGVTHMVRW